MKMKMRIKMKMKMEMEIEDKEVQLGIEDSSACLNVPSALGNACHMRNGESRSDLPRSPNPCYIYPCDANW